MKIQASLKFVWGWKRHNRRTRTLLPERPPYFFYYTR